MAPKFSCFLFFFSLCLLLAPAEAKRVALVIGNDNYQHVAKLQKARNDALAMAGALRSAGFEVIEHKDLKHRAMVRAIQALGSSIVGGDEVVIFFAGHGVQLRGGGFLLPVDIEAESEAEVERTAISLEDLSQTLTQAKPGFSLIIVDACRDNPLQSKSNRGRTIGASRGLSPIEAPKGQIVVYSAGRGQQALDRLNDNDLNPNSVFTREFIARMSRPGVRIQDLVEEVGEAVEKLARTVSHEQSPAIYNQARGSFYFYGPTTVVTQGSAKPPPAPSAEQKEEKYWQEAKSLGTKLGFEAYLKTYPNGRFAALAEGYIQKLASALPSPAVPKPRPSPSSVPPSTVASSGPTQAIQFPVSRFEPMVGDTWTFEVKDQLAGKQADNFITRRVTEKRQNNFGFVREDSKTGLKSMYWTDADLNPAYDSDGQIRHHMFLKWPLTKGTAWPAERISRRTLPEPQVTSSNLQCEVKGIEPVAVSAGQFQAVKIACIGRFNAKTQTKEWIGTMEESYWWVPSLRYFVKYQYRDRNDKGDLRNSFTHELSQFALK
jgi:hypothetical protein